MNISERILAVMEAKGMNKKMLAERLNIPAQHINSTVLNNPKFEVLERVAAALGVSIATLVTDGDAAEQPESLKTEHPTDIPAGVMICPKCGARLTVASCEECGGE